MYCITLNMDLGSYICLGEMKFASLNKLEDIRCLSFLNQNPNDLFPYFFSLLFSMGTAHALLLYSV